MSQEEKLNWLHGILEAVGVPVVYGAWPTDNAPATPYICYLSAYTNNFPADGVVYGPVIDHYQVELYTREKSPGLEKKVEDVLSGLYWEKSEEYIDNEGCFQVIYECEV